MDHFHFWLPQIIYINQSKIARQKHWPSPGGTSESWFSIKENAFTLFLPIPCSTTKAAIHLFKKQDKIKKTKRGIKGRAKSWGKENGEKGNKGGRGMRRVSKTFSHVMKKNDGEEKKKVREAGGATGRRGREGGKKKK